MKKSSLLSLMIVPFVFISGVGVEALTTSIVLSRHSSKNALVPDALATVLEPIGGNFGEFPTAPSQKQIIDVILGTSGLENFQFNEVQIEISTSSTGGSNDDLDVVITAVEGSLVYSGSYTGTYTIGEKKDINDDVNITSFPSTLGVLPTYTPDN
jgi:hypothetical protein